VSPVRYEPGFLLQRKAFFIVTAIETINIIFSYLFMMSTRKLVKLFLNRRMVSSGMLRRVALVRTDVSEESGASFIRVTRLGELGTTLALTSNRRTLRRNTNLYFFATYVGC
jgi:hypothetical protein